MRRMALWLVVGLAGLMLAGCVNPAEDIAEIKANPGGDLAAKVMVLTLPDGEAIPINYARDGNKVYAGCDGRWWRQLRGDGAKVTMLIKDEELTGTAVAIENDSERREFVFKKVRPDFYWMTLGVPIEITIDG